MYKYHSLIPSTSPLCSLLMPHSREPEPWQWSRGHRSPTRQLQELWAISWVKRKKSQGLSQTSAGKKTGVGAQSVQRSLHPCSSSRSRGASSPDPESPAESAPRSPTQRIRAVPGSPSSVVERGRRRERQWGHRGSNCL